MVDCVSAHVAAATIRPHRVCPLDCRCIMSAPVEQAVQLAAETQLPPDDDDLQSETSTLAEVVSYDSTTTFRAPPISHFLHMPPVAEDTLASVADSGVEGRDMERAWLDAQITPPIAHKAAPDVNAPLAPVPGFKGAPPEHVPSAPPVRAVKPPPIESAPVRAAKPPPPVDTAARVKPPPVVSAPPAKAPPAKATDPTPAQATDPTAPFVVAPPAKAPPLVNTPPAKAPPAKATDPTPAQATDPTAPSVEVQLKQAADAAAALQRQADLKKEEAMRLQMDIDATAAREKRDRLAAAFADETDRREAELDSQIATITTYIEELESAEAEGRASMPNPPAVMGLSQANKDASLWQAFNSNANAASASAAGVGQDRL